MKKKIHKSLRNNKTLTNQFQMLFITSHKPKKTGPWNGHSSVIFPSWKPEGISKNGNNTICLA